MKCLYEVLEVDLNSDESTIRTAYRKLALRCHPDKNQNDPHAEDRFKEIQNAYEILSDPNEKAWYDAHRDAILKSGDRHQAGASAESMAGVRPDDFVDVYAYFTSSCYSGFGDGQRSFYGVYSTLFSTIEKQESDASAARADKRGCRSNIHLPEFGLSSAEWSEVSAFYAQWASFASARDFSWAGEYNTASAPNRQIRRLMEQDNAKKTKAAKKEYNESVRSLVDFVKKRDRRVIVHQMEEAKRRQERQEADAARREAEKQERLLRAAQYKDAAWAQGSDNSADSDTNEEDDMLEEQLVWYCPVCEKHFKSEASMANHEKSKKHKELVELLRIELEAEELGVIMEEDGEEGEEGEGREEQDHDEEIYSEIASGSCDKEDRLEKKSSAPSSDDSSEVTDEASSSSSAEDDHDDVDDDDGEKEMDEDAMLASLLNARANLARKQNEATSSFSSEDEESRDHDEEKREDENGREEQEMIEEDAEGVTGEERPGSAPPLVLGGDSNSDNDDDDWGTNKRVKKKGKKGAAGGNKSGGNTAAQQQQQQSKKGGKKKAASGKQPTSSELGCSICGVEFASRNQLFKHISQTGHAQLKTSR
ncbi:hypothetical protein Ndes2526A_g01016 [Nannochloris sp. 'desiccata']|nr:hypothetical protein KSW81_002149 [Chlorella desiccata (nom. nud.)]